ncbi:MAG: MATE family efflux transporter [Bacillota bacterium]|nr:MATE family efflux transporter [Bacillota bacterium]
MNFLEKKELILNGNIKKLILSLALPIMLNNLIQTIYNLTDIFFIGKLPGNKIASISFVWPIIFFMLSFGLGISMAGSGLISQYIGSNQEEKAKKLSGQIITFSIIFSIIFGIIGSIFSFEILSFMGAKGDLLIYADKYLEIMFLGMPTMFMMFAYNGIKNGEGDTFTPMIITLTSVILNIFLDPIFMFTFNLGIKGAAIATVISRGIFGTFAIYTLFTKRNELQLSLSDLKVKKDLLQKLLQIGLPASIGQSTAALGFAVLNIFIVSFGEATLTAFTLGNRISSLIMMPAMGIGSALAPIVGQNIGANQISRAKKSIKTSVIMSTIFLVLGGIVILYFSNSILLLFTTDKEIIKQGIPYVRLITLSLPLMGYFQILNGIFQGSGHTKSSMFLMIGRLWILRIPIIIIFKNYTDLSYFGVWYAMILSNFITVLVGYIMYKTGKWEKKVIKEKNISLKINSN